MPKTTAPPKTRKDGTAMSGAYPLNHRLRAEALCKDGKTTDPDGLISAELIADTKARLDGLSKIGSKSKES